MKLKGKKVHLIAIGGAIMHNLAIVLKEKGCIVTGSDDIIYDPSKSRLSKAGLLPKQFGWFENNIHQNLDFIILGMHARKHNPELIKAQELKIPIFSFPSFIGEFAKNKKRIVIAGSHGKTTTSAMLIHVLRKCKLKHDYLLGAQLEGFKNMVQLSDAPLMVIEGDEYLSSALDRRPKFLHYNPDISVITGIEWDHINVFKTEKIYNEQFVKFLGSMSRYAVCYAFKNDEHMDEAIAATKLKPEITRYDSFHFERGNIHYQNEKYPVKIFGQHNMANLKATYLISRQLGISKKEFFNAIESFPGAAKRQEFLFDSQGLKVFWDFAHAPSKVRETVKAFRSNFHEPIASILELHTYSSLNKNFLKKYKDTLNGIENAAIFFNPQNLKIKKMPALSTSFIRKQFGRDDLTVLDSPAALEKHLQKIRLDFKGIVLFMSSGQLGGLDINRLLAK